MNYHYYFLISFIAGITDEDLAAIDQMEQDFLASESEKKKKSSSMMSAQTTSEPSTSISDPALRKVLYERLRFLAGNVGTTSYRFENSALTSEMRELYQAWDSNSDIFRAYLEATIAEGDRDLVEATLLSTDSMDLKIRVMSLTEHGLSVKEAFFILLLKKFQASKGKFKGKALY